MTLFSATVLYGSAQTLDSQVGRRSAIIWATTGTAWGRQRLVAERHFVLLPAQLVGRVP